MPVSFQYANKCFALHYLQQGNFVLNVQYTKVLLEHNIDRIIIVRLSIIIVETSDLLWHISDGKRDSFCVAFCTQPILLQMNTTLYLSIYVRMREL